MIMYVAVQCTGLVCLPSLVYAANLACLNTVKKYFFLPFVKEQSIRRTMARSTSVPNLK